MNEPKIVDVFRYDKIAIKGKGIKTDEGYLISKSPVAQVGVYKYRLTDGTTRSELVDSETLSNIESNDSLKFKPVTNNHPRERIINSSNSKMRSVGSVGETITNEDDFLMVNFSVTDSEMIKDINNGRKQLSPGYRVNVVMTPGTHNGVHYDGIQRNRKYNHLAIVDNARGGNELQINVDHLDSGDAVVDGIYINNSNDNDNKNKESRSMETYKIDGLPYEAAPEVVNYISKLTNKIDALNSDVTKATENLSKAEAKTDALEEKVKEFDKHDSKDELAKEVKIRISLEKNATKVLKEDSFDGMNNEDIMRKVIISKSPGKNKDEITKKLDSKDAVYIEARYDAIVENLDEESFTKQINVGIGNNGQNNGSKDDRYDAVKARDKYIKDLENGYKQTQEA